MTNANAVDEVEWQGGQVYLHLGDADGHCLWCPGLPDRRGRGGLFERAGDDRLQHAGDVLDGRLRPDDDQTSTINPGDDVHGLAG